MTDTKPDPLVVVGRYITRQRRGGLPVNFEDVWGELAVLQKRLDKVRRLFPEYKNLTFGPEYDELLEQLKGESDANHQSGKSPRKSGPRPLH